MVDVKILHTSRVVLEVCWEAGAWWGVWGGGEQVFSIHVFAIKAHAECHKDGGYG